MFFLTQNKIKLIAFAIALGLSSNSMAATAVVDTDGRLTGVSDINLGPSGFWDASFHNTWQENLYSTQFSYDATHALHNFFLSSPPSDVTSVNGCERAYLCRMLTPYELSHNFGFTGEYMRMTGWNVITEVTALGNIEVISTPLILGLNFNLGAVGIDNDFFTYTQWSPSNVGTVPIPAAAFMFAPALLGFMGFRRRAKNLAA